MQVLSSHLRLISAAVTWVAAIVSVHCLWLKIVSRYGATQTSCLDRAWRSSNTVFAHGTLGYTHYPISIIFNISSGIINEEFKDSTDGLTKGPTNQPNHDCHVDEKTIMEPLRTYKLCIFYGEAQKIAKSWVKDILSQLSWITPSMCHISQKRREGGDNNLVKNGQEIKARQTRLDHGVQFDSL